MIRPAGDPKGTLRQRMRFGLNRVIRSGVSVVPRLGQHLIVIGPAHHPVFEIDHVIAQKGHGHRCHLAGVAGIAVDNNVAVAASDPLRQAVDDTTVRGAQPVAGDLIRQAPVTEEALFFKVEGGVFDDTGMGHLQVGPLLPPVARHTAQSAVGGEDIGRVNADWAADPPSTSAVMSSIPSSNVSTPMKAI